MREEEVSLRGRTARSLVQIANHLPVPEGDMKREELRKKLDQHELPWHPKGDLKNEIIELPNCKAELLFEPDPEDDPPEEAFRKGTEDRKVVLQLHGGGYYHRIRNVYREAAVMYHGICNADVFSLDYRVAPEHPFPAALEDTVDAYEWLLDTGYLPEHIFVAGDSAGGGLTLALIMYLRDHGRPLPKKAVTMSAWTDLKLTGESYQEKFLQDPVFGQLEDSLVTYDGYYRDQDPGNPYISPLNGDFRDFPPVLMQVGEQEMLLSDTLGVAEKLKEAGREVTLHVYPGMFHVFQLGFNLYPEATEAWKEVETFLADPEDAEDPKG
ncbi:MAG: alpha/beta hydrolase [Lachnospiraceae bacterium]|nr:alpha/beta hydrolase [Lachnospiraceae bacterium]